MSEIRTRTLSDERIISVLPAGTEVTGACIWDGINAPYLIVTTSSGVYIGDLSRNGNVVHPLRPLALVADGGKGRQT